MDCSDYPSSGGPNSLARRAGEWDSEGSLRMSMRTVVPVITLLVGLAVAPLAADARDDAKKQVQFGISVAQKSLWREAIFWWERATKVDPTYAAAHNNLAIAYEHEGDLAKARAAYEKALELEPNNAMIKQNYELFKEINDRTTRKTGQ